ncbi:EpsG family protein [Halomonas halocynthiae]|uniref:EpsG family protein n=1 Tax=Halomonas halocynthiae TaxID=176290 RepID=UPI00040FE114|nr:EpsG family protein [Halomonas halocynthiae]
MIYITGWLFLYIGFFLQEGLRYRGRAFLVTVVFYFLAVAVFRGDVGTDTASYTLMVENLTQGFVWGGAEPAFVVFVTLLGSWIQSSELVVRLFSLLFFLLLFVYIARSDRNESFFIISYFLPAFSYTYSMNGMRIGVAVVLLLLAAQTVRRGGKVIASGLVLSSIFFHYSIIFPLVYITFSQVKWSRVSNVLIFLFGISFFIVFVLTFMLPYVVSKISLYSDYSSPGALSGVGKVVPVFLMVLGVSLGRLGDRRKYKIVFIGVSATLLSVFLAQFSYAGLRFLDLISIAFPVSVVLAYSSLNIDFDFFVKTSFVLSGVVSVGATFRNFLLEYGQGPTPFLPYEFFWSLL